MSFTFKIEQILPRREGAFVVLIGPLLSGKMHVNDVIGVPMQDGTIVPRAILDIDANYKKVDEVKAGQAEMIGVLVGNVPNVAMGQATDYSREAYTAEQAEKRHIYPSQPAVQPKRSPWWAFWRRS